MLIYQKLENPSEPRQVIDDDFCHFQLVHEFLINPSTCAGILNFRMRKIQERSMPPVFNLGYVQSIFRKYANGSGNENIKESEKMVQNKMHYVDSKILMNYFHKFLDLDEKPYNFEYIPHERIYYNRKRAAKNIRTVQNGKSVNIGEYSLSNQLGGGRSHVQTSSLHPENNEEMFACWNT